MRLITSAFGARPAIAVVCVLLGVAGAASAQQGGVYDLRWNTIDGGGVTWSTGGSYRLGATLGQPDAGQASGGVYILAGGFWEGGSWIVVSVEEPGDDPTESPGGVPIVTALRPAFPNPARDAVEIAFDLEAPRDVHLSIFDLQGARVRTLVDRNCAAGAHRVAWDGADEKGHAVGSGTYFIRLEAGPFVRQRKVVVIR